MGMISYNSATVSACVLVGRGTGPTVDLLVYMVHYPVFRTHWTNIFEDMIGNLITTNRGEITKAGGKQQ